jgi:hypothetical protein
MAAVDAKHQIGPNEEWYLHFHSDLPLQPYRTAHAVWPLSTEELSRTESQAQSDNASALNNLGTNERPTDGPANLTHFACGVTGAMHLFGWGQRPVNRYKAYDCFCRAHSAGCAAATHNRAVCKRLGLGCKLNYEEALAQLEAVVAADTKVSTACLMALVSAAARFVSAPPNNSVCAGLGQCAVSRATRAFECNFPPRHQRSC